MIPEPYPLLQWYYRGEKANEKGELIVIAKVTPSFLTARDETADNRRFNNKPLPPGPKVSVSTYVTNGW